MRIKNKERKGAPFIPNPNQTKPKKKKYPLGVVGDIGVDTMII